VCVWERERIKKIALCCMDIMACLPHKNFSLVLIARFVGSFERDTSGWDGKGIRPTMVRRMNLPLGRDSVRDRRERFLGFIAMFNENSLLLSFIWLAG
jgi:hypothetical protein